MPKIGDKVPKHIADKITPASDKELRRLERRFAKKPGARPSPAQSKNTNGWDTLDPEGEA